MRKLISSTGVAALALAAVALVLAAGQTLTKLKELPTWLGCLRDVISIEYIKDLGPEIGGSGLDALLVGGIAGFVGSRLSRAGDDATVRRALENRLRHGRPVILKDHAMSGILRLPLWAPAFHADRVEDRELKSPVFVSKGREPPAFYGCDFVGTTIERGTFVGSSFLDTSFEACDLARCDFSAITMEVENNSRQPFPSTRVKRCCFEGATFRNIELAEGSATFIHCTFWGAVLDRSRLPADVERRLVDASALQPVEETSGSRRVLTRLELLQRPTWKRIKLLAGTFGHGC